MNFSQRQWKQAQWSRVHSEKVAEETGLPLAIAALLQQRNIDTVEKIHNFLHPTLSQLPSPFLMHGMETAVNIITRAIFKNTPVLVYGDYDADGTTGTAVLVRFLKSCKANVRWRQPNRLTEGYGLQADHLVDFSKTITRTDEQPAGLVITVDCGISNCPEVKLAHQLGLEIIITDHHQPSAELPEAGAIINPKIEVCGFPFKGLAGVGVAFYLVMGLRNRLEQHDFWSQHRKPNLKEYLDLVAIGTIGDIVPLDGVNRILVKAGLEALTVTKWPGVRSLLQSSGIDPNETPTSEDIAFRIVPKLNAPGRMSDPQDALEILLTDDRIYAEQLSVTIREINEKRKTLGQLLYEKLAPHAELAQRQGRKTIVLHEKDLHRGVIGIIASRFLAKYHRPTIILSIENGVGTGSARSIPGFDIHAGLQACAGLLDGLGGHPAAAGLRIQTSNISFFSNKIEEIAEKMIDEADLTPCITVDWQDVHCDKSFLVPAFFKNYQKMEPFGIGNELPIFAEKGVLRKNSIVGGNHLKFYFESSLHTINGIAFGKAEALAPFIDRTIELAYTLHPSTFKGETSWEIRIVDIRHEASA